ncbi:MAG TPA: hypothetical protein VM597_09910 [Gemmataceae bacterium]|nr:hypothetical protein [Gemmataceae bacterium]
MAFDVNHAIRRNAHFAPHLGWDRYSDLIARHFGYPRLSDREFVEAVAQWQTRHRPPLTADGILGPDSWRELREELRLSPQIDLARAIRLNGVWARRLRWDTLRGRVAEFLRFRDQTPDDTQLARAVAAWQADHPPLSADGILGPGTWAAMTADGLTYTAGPPAPRPAATVSALAVAPAAMTDGGLTAITPVRPAHAEQALRHDTQIARQNRGGQTIVYINGMATNAATHLDTVRSLGALLHRQVTGIYNATGESTTGRILVAPIMSTLLGAVLQWQLSADALLAIEDFGECVHDYGLPVSWFAGPAARLLGGTLTEEQRMRFGRGALAGNAAAVAVFDRLAGLTARGSGSLYVIAHSQGNLILANVLYVLQWVRRPRPLARRLFVYSLASPSPSWPVIPEMRHRPYAFSNDPVTWLAGFGRLTGSTPGRQTGTPGAQRAVAHTETTAGTFFSIPAHDVGGVGRSGGFTGYMGRGDFYEQISRDLGDI